MKKTSWVAMLVVVAACRGKSDSAVTAPGGSGSAGSAPGPIAAGGGSADAGATAGTGDGAGSATPARAVSLSQGALHFGCVGWSPTVKAAACITGRTHTNEPSTYLMTYVGSEEPATPMPAKQGDFGDMYDEPSRLAVNAILGKLSVLEFPTPAIDVAKPGTTDLGKGATLVWTSQQTDQGGDNMPPTNKHSAKLSCGGTTIDVVDSLESEGIDPTFKVWRLGEHVVVETLLNTAREGEFGEERTAMLVELSTCEVAP